MKLAKKLALFAATLGLTLGAWATEAGALFIKHHPH